MSGWKSQVRWEISQVKGKLSLTTIKQMIHSNEPQLWLLIKATIQKNKNKIKNYHIHILVLPCISWSTQSVRKTPMHAIIGP